MARTVDPARHTARRLQIIDAGLTRFASDGYGRATTAAICRTAGIGSGTFFHYFPTKLSLLLAILDFGTGETRDWFAAQEGRTDGLAVIEEYVIHSVAEFADPRVGGFVRAVGAVMTEPQVAAALALDETTAHAGLRPWLECAQSSGQIRTDLDPDRLAHWVLLILDGFLGRLSGAASFQSDQEGEVLLDTVRRLLRAP